MDTDLRRRHHQPTSDHRRKDPKMPAALFFIRVHPWLSVSVRVAQSRTSQRKPSDRVGEKNQA
jgi:hypothetical protein